MFWFSLQISSETFLILRRNERDMITNVYWSSCKALLTLSCRISTVLVRYFPPPNLCPTFLPHIAYSVHMSYRKFLYHVYFRVSIYLYLWLGFCDIIFKSNINYIYSLSVSPPSSIEKFWVLAYCKNSSCPPSCTWSIKKSSSKVALLSVNRREVFRTYDCH